jgi:hypothetical protein
MESIHQPIASLQAARECAHCRKGIVEPLAFEHRICGAELALLRQRERVKEMMGIAGNIALGKPLQEHLGSLGMIVKKRRSGCEGKDVGVAWMGLRGLLRQRQETGCSSPVREGVEEDRVPSDRSRIPERKRALCGGHETLVWARHDAGKTVRVVIRIMKA